MKKIALASVLLALMFVVSTAPVVRAQEPSGAGTKASQEVLTPEQKAAKEEAAKEADAYKQFPGEPAFLEVHALDLLAVHPLKPDELVKIFEKFPLKVNISRGPRASHFHYAGWDYRDFAGALNLIGAKAEYIDQARDLSKGLSLVRSGSAARILMKVIDLDDTTMYATVENDGYHHSDGNNVPWSYKHTIAVYNGTSIYDFSKLPARIPLGSRVSSELSEFYQLRLTPAIIIFALPPAPKDEQHP